MKGWLLVGRTGKVMVEFMGKVVGRVKVHGAGHGVHLLHG